MAFANVRLRYVTVLPSNHIRLIEEKGTKVDIRLSLHAIASEFATIKLDNRPRDQC